MTKVSARRPRDCLLEHVTAGFLSRDLDRATEPRHFLRESDFAEVTPEGKEPSPLEIGRWEREAAETPAHDRPTEAPVPHPAPGPARPSA
jgi:hypothetical protein